VSQDKNLINLNDESNENSQPKKQAAKETESKKFRMISKIEPQKRKGRYNIFIDESFAFGVDEEVLIKFELRKGVHVSKKIQRQIESEETYNKAYQKTLNYLNYALRSEKQIRDYIKKNDFDLYSERIVDSLKNSKLIDDLNYAQSYVRSQANVKQKGPRNIEQKLKQRGISDEDIMTALEEYPPDQRFENALELAEKKWNKTRNSSEFESVQKVKKYLVGKGYEFSMADQAIEEINTEKDTEEEYEALVKQGDKAYRRYQRKYEGYELKQRLRRYLYSKGYPNELIKRYIDEREMG